MGFEEHVLARVARALSASDATAPADVYALSFFVWAEEDDPRRVRLSVTYNTEARARACTPGRGQEPDWPIASDALEARWNYAFWLQGDGAVCELGETAEDAAARVAWIASLKLGWTDEDEAADFEATCVRGERILEEIEHIAVSVAARLHASGAICAAFGRPLPIVVHDLEYDPRFALLTLDANPPGVASEVANWIASLA